MKIDGRKSRQEAREQLGVGGSLNWETAWLSLSADWGMELSGHGYRPDLEK